MTPRNNTPSERDLAINILQFLASSPSSQLTRLSEYRDYCNSRGGRVAHVADPFLEIAEGLLKLTSEGKRQAFDYESHCVVEELECVLGLVFDRPEGCIISDEQLSEALEWRVVRRLAALAVREIGASECSLSVCDILNHVSD